MVRFPNVKVDPWFSSQEQYKKYKRIPDEVVFICPYLVFMNPIDYGESAFFRIDNNIDELWIATWDAEFNEDYMNMEHGNKDLFKDFGCVVSAPSIKDTATASATLLMHLPINLRVANRSS